MFLSQRLLHACRITLFSRDNCGLCIQAKGVLSNVWDKRPFEFKEVNLAQSDSKSWRDLYDFDIPVIHINKAQAAEENVADSGKAVKLMHRFTEQEVESKMDAVEK